MCTQHAKKKMYNDPNRSPCFKIMKLNFLLSNDPNLVPNLIALPNDTNDDVKEPPTKTLSSLRLRFKK